jgi:membrane protease YdiL (CAAX protease family)
MEQNRFFWLRGVAVFAAAMALLFSAGVFFQSRFGMYGILYTQFLLLAVSIAGVFILKLDFKEVFPVKLPRIRQIFGVIIMVPAGMLVSVSAIYPVIMLFPQSLETMAFLQNLFQSVPGVTGWLIVALSPAICEEALHRGVIQHTFLRSGFKNKWTIILCMGFIFGIFHADPVRFLPTAILGTIMTYIALESKNILLPVLYHFVNNSLSFFAGSFSSSDGAELSEAMDMAGEMMLEFFVVCLVLSLIGLFILRLGARLVKPIAAPKPSPIPAGDCPEDAG